ncbi:MAG TPA: hypothetical protein VNJ04_06815 [Gemmatimonadaceae bacterium]|nr:hypothetical protein [Gemmatimonadaceae bacterium]
MKFSLASLRLGSLAAAFIGAAACTENLGGDGACPILCPTQGGDIQNVTLDAIVFDTTVITLSGLGTEPGLLLASRGDTLDTRVVIRFDSLPTKFNASVDTGRTILSVDSAHLRLRLDTLSLKVNGPLTIEAFDVDTVANDTSTAAIAALFRPDRFISSQSFARADLRDTLRYNIPNDVVLAKIRAGARLRIGLRAVGSAQVRILAVESGAGPQLFFRPTPDTTFRALTVSPLSRTPVGESFAAMNLSDYTVVLRSPSTAETNTLNIGGLPARRTYIRFNIPSSIIDSSNVVRATLLLNQIANTSLDPGDTIFLVPQIVVAGAVVTDPARASQVLSEGALDTLKVRAGDSGEKQIELVRAIPFWRSQRPEVTPRAIVIRTLAEGNSPLEARFSPLEAQAGLRPRLRISFTRRAPLGLP